MPDPTRPVAHAPIASDWGQAIHDRVFTPKGSRVAGGASTAVGTTFEQLQLNTAVDDPGGWLASDALTVPAGGTGLYAYYLDVQTDNGEADEFTRVQVRVNGASVNTFRIPQDGTNAITDGRSGLLELDAADVLTIYAAKTGGTDPDVLVQRFAVIITASEIGA